MSSTARGRSRAALKIARDTARALAAAHERGIVHRDIKPQNILVAPDWSDEPATPDTKTTIAISSGIVSRFQVLLTDFGLARVAGEESLTVDSGAIVGTVAYMSPKQAHMEKGQIGEASDVYSLGATLYQMVTGVLPFLPEGGNP